MGKRGRSATATPAKRASPSPRARAPRPPLAPVSWASPPYVFALAVMLACALVSVSFRIYDYDLWEHLAFGRALWHLHALPRTNLWTWPDPARAIVNPSWGFSAIVWPFWTLGGALGLALWRWLTTLAVFVLLWRTARALGMRESPSLVVFVIAALVYRQRSQVRPETLAAVLLALECWLLATRNKVAAPRDAALVGIVWVWANVHVSWPLGVLLLAIAWFAARRPHAPAMAPPGSLGRVVIGAALVAFVNPFGWHAVWRPFEFALLWRHDPLLSGISELQPIDWRLNLSNGLPLLMLGWPALALWRWRRHGLDRAELLACACFSALALSGTRFVAAYAVVAAPWCARDLDAWLRERGLSHRLGGAWRTALVTAAVCIAAGLYEWRTFEAPLGIAIDERRYPVAACDYMQAHDVRGRGINDFYLGGYQVWRFWPDRTRLPFIDIHPEDKPAAERLAYQLAFTSRRGWEALDSQYHFDYALLSRSHVERYGLLDLLDSSPGWALVFVDDTAALYVKRDGPLAALAAEQGYRFVPGGRMKQEQVGNAALADTSVAAALRLELARVRQGSPATRTFAQLRRALGMAGE